jgi:hypothetical protein
MPPRFAYWTILVGGLPTAFRAAEREEIEPTFRQLQQKHSDAEMRWFARGKLWASPEEAREALERAKDKGQRTKDQGRDRNWRPGGSHRDPRQPYIDAKKRENQRRRERRFEFKKDSRPQAPGFRPDRERPKWERPKWTDRPQATGQRPHEERPKWKRPSGAEGPGSEKRWKSQSRPGAWRPKPGAAASKPAWKPKPDPWRGPHSGARIPDSEGRPKKWEGPGPKWQSRGSRAPGSGPHDQQPKWKKPLGQEEAKAEKPWKPKPWRGPKTEDRRPKTGSGPGTGRAHWSGRPGGQRKGPGKGRGQ